MQTSVTMEEDQTESRRADCSEVTRRGRGGRREGRRQTSWPHQKPRFQLQNTHNTTRMSYVLLSEAATGLIAHSSVLVVHSHNTG